MIWRDIAVLLAAGLLAAGNLANAADPGTASSRDAPPGAAPGVGAAPGRDGRGAAAVPGAPADRLPKPPAASAAPSCAVSDPSALPCRHTDGRGRR
jgi:hypothetical protein